jgi:hypothetical protein
MVLGLPCGYGTPARCHSSESDALRQVKTRKSRGQLRDPQQPTIFKQQRKTEIPDDVCFQRA